MRKRKKTVRTERLVILITLEQKEKLTRESEEKEVSLAQLVRERLFPK